MGFPMSTRGSIISDWFELLHDIGNFERGIVCDVALYEDHHEVTAKGKRNKIMLDYTQVTDVFHGKKLAKTLRGLCGLDDAMSDRSPFEKDIEL